MSQRIDRREIVEAVLGTEKAEGGIDVERIVRERVHKNRRYISDPSEAPEWANVQEGQRGGYYYDPQESLGLDESEMYTLAEESVLDLNPDDYPSEEYMVDDVEDGMMDMIEDELDVDFMELDDDTYDQLTSALRGYAEETVDDAFMIENTEKSIEERVRERFNVGKSRVYVDSPEDVPDQYEDQTSERGAVYYDTDGVSGGSEDFEPADVEMAIRDVEPADVEMALRDELDIDPDDFDSAGELAPRVGLVLEDFIDAQFGDAAHEQFTMGEDGDVLDDVAMDLAEEYTIQ